MRRALLPLLLAAQTAHADLPERRTGFQLEPTIGIGYKDPRAMTVPTGLGVFLRHGMIDDQMTLGRTWYEGVQLGLTWITPVSTTNIQELSVHPMLEFGQIYELMGISIGWGLQGGPDWRVTANEQETFFAGGLIRGVGSFGYAVSPKVQVLSRVELGAGLQQENRADVTDSPGRAYFSFAWSFGIRFRTLFRKADSGLPEGTPGE